MSFNNTLRVNTGSKLIGSVLRSGAILYGEGPPSGSSDPDVINAQDYQSYVDTNTGQWYGHRKGKWDEKPFYPVSDKWIFGYDQPNLTSRAQFVFDNAANVYEKLPLGGTNSTNPAGSNPSPLSVIIQKNTNINIINNGPPSQLEINFGASGAGTYDISYAYDYIQQGGVQKTLNCGLIKYPAGSPPSFPMNQTTFDTLVIQGTQDSESSGRLSGSANDVTVGADETIKLVGMTTDADALAFIVSHVELSVIKPI